MPTLSASSINTVTAITTSMTATGNSTDIVQSNPRVLAAQANVVGSGSVSATVNLQGSLDGTYYTTLYTFTLSGTTSASDIKLLDATFLFYRVNVSAISGTSATVSVYIKT